MLVEIASGSGYQGGRAEEPGLVEMRIAKRTRVRRVMLTVTAIIAVIAVAVIVFVLVAGRADPAPAGNASIKVINVSSVHYG